MGLFRSRRTGDATATDGAIANTGIMRFPARTRRDEVAERMAAGPPVTLPREAANFAENLLIRLAQRPNLLDDLGWGHCELEIAECRRVVSAAIEACDRRQS
jgi:hypothetical protein